MATDAVASGTAPLPRSAAVVIVGGGVIGASIAFHLAEAGVTDVVLVERDTPASGSSGKPIGGVRAQFSDPLNIRLGQRSLEAWRAFAERPGADVGLRDVGYLFLLADDEQLETFREGVEVQNGLGVPSRIVSPREAHALCPYLDPGSIVAAAWCPSDGYALPGAAVGGYLRAARALGATVRTHCAVTGVDASGGEVRAVRTTAGTVRTGTVICAAGAWSREIGAMAGLDLPVTPLRRQIALTGPLSPPPPRVPFTLDYGSTLYFHGDGAGGLVLGLSDPDERPGFAREYSEEWLDLFRAAAARRAPALAGVPVRGGWAGLYEMTPDRNALIGEAPGSGRFLYATGFSGHGFLQAPAVGEVVRDLYLGRTPFLDVGPLAADRFDGPASSGVRPEAHII
ncbi:NAD(P)/FAD-dependent oxidoreductase [Streptomyces sp. SP18CS02]|uniref:NAD(P)/FAD-dependent oxidoreductase n=1 Tax=Streptomyces sp. SP18CS02 TaxID=3002531 RepID=UPI002E77AA81|nr:FAD-binding oxidoreductase [Streptomyces sp. SP18CS02]MEE1755380.1 FAD-binding oxidoreductase [Streptomyces sp. SP18CS02]